MAKPTQSPFPQDLIIGPNWQVVFDAIDPVTGASVAGVTVTAANVTATNAESGKQEVLTPGPFMLVPGPNGTVVA